MVCVNVALASLGLLCSLFLPIGAVPFQNSSLYSYDHGLSRRAEDFYLRIMPLGASITKGDPAPPGSDGNGYRKPLRDQLRFEDWKVNMVGSQLFGTMQDADNEGYPGFRVEEVHKVATPSLRQYKPNLILINAGTNDATQNYDVGRAGMRMESMILECFAQVPETVVILSTLIPNGQTLSNGSPASNNVNNINNQYRNLYHKLKDQNLHIVLAEMNDGSFITMADIWKQPDGTLTHPTADGFKKMAAVWNSAINEALKNDWVKPPSTDVTFKDDDQGSNTCPKTYGSGAASSLSGVQVLTASSNIIGNDGPYVHSSVSMGTIFTKKVSNGDQFFLAQLVNLHDADRGGERDDIIYVHDDSDDIQLFVNNGNGDFDTSQKVNVGQYCSLSGIRWGDVNNDGLDDFICITDTGDMKVSINKGGNPPKFSYLSNIYKFGISGYTQFNVRLADIDGDGRLDYCVAAASGDIHCWRNGGFGDAASYWQDLGLVAPGRNMGDLTGVVFVDINGDFRDDWLWLDPNGAVTTYINQRDGGDGLAPYWDPSGKTHGGMGRDTGGHQNILFGKLYDSGKADYVFVDISDGTANLKAWKNTGSGGRYPKGDGAHWGDMTGTGNDDYVWITHDGKISIFRNKNVPPDTSKYGHDQWETMGTVLQSHCDRKGLHLGDWDGDGKADIICVNKHSGELSIWFTKYTVSGGFEYAATPTVIPNSAKCNKGWGVGLYDIAARFANISGGKRVDYLCMAPDGRTEGWLNYGDKTMEYVGQVKFSENYDRANHRFADVNGDGLADFLWVDKFNGDTKVWYNKGILDPDKLASGSRFLWEPQGKLYQGSSSGPDLHFPNLGGIGRADMVDVNPRTAFGYAWFNLCPRGGDDGDITDPQLPAYGGGSVDPTDPPDDSNPGKSFCSKSTAYWNTDLWNELEVGEWLESTSRWYSLRPGGWPLSAAKDPPSVPIDIARFNFGVEDSAFEWKSGCKRLVGDSCETPDYTTQTCEDHWQRIFALWNMRNYALFLQNYQKFLDKTEFTASLNIAKISEVFLASQKPDSAELGPDAWLAIVSGILTAVGGFAGPAEPAVNAVIGILGIEGALLGAYQEPAEPSEEFKTFADLQQNFGKLVTEADKANNNYYNTLFATLPEDGDEAAGTALATVLKSGLFSEEEIALIPVNNTVPDLLKTMITAPIISELWNSQRLFIAKIPRGKIFLDSGGVAEFPDFIFDPCFGEDKHDDILSGKLYCPPGSEQNGFNNYVVLSWDSHDDVMFNNDYGANDEALKDFGLSLEKVIESAIRVQETARDFTPHNPGVMQTIIGDIARHPESAASSIKETFFINIPVCDLSNIQITYRDEKTCRQQNSIYYSYCLNTAIMDACVKFSIDGHQWPYEKDQHGF